MQQPLISVIVPIYNAELYLKECIDSIINQSYVNLEIILLNDGSSDKSEIICQSYLSDNRVVYVKHDNGGLSYTRNRGISIARGGYIVFVDSDDFIHQRMIEILYTELQKNGVNFVQCRYTRGNLNTDIGVYKVDNYNVQDVVERECLSRQSDRNIRVWGGIFKKDLIKNIQFYDGMNYEDWPFMSEVFKRQQYVYQVQEPLYFYRETNGGITSGKTLKNCKDKLLSKILSIEILNDTYKETLVYLRGAANIEAINDYSRLSRGDKKIFYKELCKNHGYLVYNLKELLESHFSRTQKLELILCKYVFKFTAFLKAKVL